MSSPPPLFDRKLYLERQAKASGEAHALLQQRMAEDVADRLSLIKHHFAKAIVLAAHPEAVVQALAATGQFGEIMVLPVAEDDLGLEPLCCDAVISLLDLNCVNDVPGYLAQVAAGLRPDGLALFGFFAGETLKELRAAWLEAETDVMGGASLRVAPMIDLRETGSLLQRAGLALPVADLDRNTLRYDSALALMQEVKALGLANSLLGRHRGLVPPHLLLRVADLYARDHRDADGRVAATVEIAWAMAWKPHPSQQQALKPGSAKTRLAEALKVR